MNIVNQPTGKIDGMDIATGKPVYTADLADKHALVVKILRSPHAFAKIKSINKTRAEGLVGVECVLTYEDVPQTRFTVAGQSYPESSPYDRLILDEYVRYIGDPVAIVAADNEEQANKALKLIKVEYEVLEPVLDPEKAIGHPSIIHPEEVENNFDFGMDQERNITAKIYKEFGNVEEEMAKADVFVEETYYPQAQAHGMMETFRAFSFLDHLGRLTVISSTQIPFHIRRILSRALEIPKSKIRVIKPRIGGGFGGKQTGSMEVYPAYVTMKTGKPATLIYDRRETFNATTSRHAMKIKVKIGASSDGIIQAIDIETLSDTGAYGEHGWAVTGLVGSKTLPLYHQAKGKRHTANIVYTNKMPAGAFRGFGATQGTFAMESAVNQLASKLNMDPSVIRGKNLIKQGDASFAFDGATKDTPVTLNSSTLDQCIARGKELIGWDKKYPKQIISNTKFRGVGMAVTMQGSGIAGIDTASAIIKLNEDGFYTLLLGATDMGQGSDTVLAQIAAEVLETPLENIIVYTADTDISPYDPGSYASSATYVTGNAVVRAAENLKEKILASGSRLLNIPAEELDFIEGNIQTDDSTQSMTINELAQKLASSAGKEQLVGTGTFGGDTSPPPFIAGFAEVEVDTETGKVDLIDYVAVIDCGTVINPTLAKVQAEGGLAQGIGLALFEEVHYTARGKMATDTFMQYKIPSRKDINNIRVEFISSYEPTGPFGAKSIGEVVTNTPSPAIAHAVYNAVGVWVRDLPITPEKVFRAINKM